MQDTPYPLLSIFAFLGFIVALVPLRWHFQAWNAGTCVYMIWASFACLIQFVDSIVWHGTAENLAPVWCDISTKFLIGAGVGIPAASLCINRRLYKITSTRTVSVTREDKRRQMFWDLGISVGIPVLVMILHYIVQGHRFNILEDVGCLPDIFNTPPAYPLVFMWPVLLGCISFVYASLTLRGFWIRRMQFSELLSSNNAMTTSRYFRLMLLSCTEMACTIPLGAYSIYINTAGVELAPWVSWSNAHFGFSRVVMVPAIIWTSNRSYLISVEMGRWIYPCSAFLFFALFGFAEEARRNYRAAFWTIAKLFGVKPSQKRSAFGSLGSLRFGSYPKKGASDSDDTLPPYAPPTPAHRKRPGSLSSSLAGSVIDIDLEKAAQFPSSTSATLACAESPTFSDLSPRDFEFVEPRSRYSLASPDVAIPFPVLPRPHSLAEREHVSIPPFHRPFTPPTVCAISPSEALAQCSSIRMTIHTEHAEATESV